MGNRWMHPSFPRRLRIEFVGGPACGAVVRVPPEELPGNPFAHPDHPGADYFLFKRLEDGRLTARYAPPE